MVQRITLRAYLDELEALLREESFNEVISHCRHILRHYPQNAETYRLLGQALLQKGHHGGGPEYFDQAAEVFQRVLGVSPTDHVAHLCMSEIREHHGQLDQAIWHLERAYEQMPGNTAIQEEIRKLYARRDGEDRAPEKIQLTRGALARQYANGQLYDQALIELRAALEQVPSRIDWQILLAETLWESQHFVEAAEVAVQILKQLPNCLAANRILAQVWLENERPTDAQVFLDRIAAIDPYEAARTVQPDVDVPDTNILPHLDYNAQAAAALSTETPDWVQELGDLGVAEMDAALNLSPQVAPMGAGSSDQIDMNALFGNGMGSDVPGWMGDFQDSQADQPVPDWFEIEESNHPVPFAADPLNSAPSSDELLPGDNLPDWFAELGGDTGPTQADVNWAPPGDGDAGLSPGELDDLILGLAHSAEQTGEPSVEEPDWPLPAVDEGASGVPEPSFEDLLGPVGEQPTGEPDWPLPAVDEGASGVPEPSFEDLLGSVGEQPISEPDWLVPAVDESPAGVPEPSSDDFIGGELLGEEDWLQEVKDIVSDQEEAPSGFTDLLAEVEAARAVNEEPPAEAVTPPEWIAAFRKEPQEAVEDTFLGSLDDETEFLAAFDQASAIFDVKGDSLELPEVAPSFTPFEAEIQAEEPGAITPEELEALRQGMMPPPDTDFSEFMPSDELEIEPGGLIADEPIADQHPGLATEPEQDYFAPAADWGNELKSEPAADVSARDDWLSGLDEVDEANLIERLMSPAKSDLGETTEEEPDKGFGWAQPEAATDDWLSSFVKMDEEPAFSELLSEELTPAEQPPEEDRALAGEWLGEVTDLVTFETAEDSTFGPGGLDKEAGIVDEPLPTEDEGRSLPEFVVEDDDSAPAWMADLAPVETSAAPHDAFELVDQPYPLYEDSGSEQQPAYWAAQETGILQPDEDLDWMKAFSGEEAPPDETLGVDVLEEEAAVSLNELDLGFGPAPDQRDTIAANLAGIEGSLSPVQETSFAEEGGGLPDWLVAITSSEADKLEDVVWEEPETYSSAEDTGVLQPTSQPDWLMSVAEQHGDEDEAPAELDLSELTLDAVGPEMGAEPLPENMEEERSAVWDEAEPVDQSESDAMLFEMLAAGKSEEKLEERVELDSMFFDDLEMEAIPDQLAEADAAFFDALKASAGEPGGAALDEFNGDLDLHDEEIAQPVDLAHTSEIVEEADEADINLDDFAFRNKVPAWLRPPKESNLASPASTISESAPEIPEWLRDISENDDSD